MTTTLLQSARPTTAPILASVPLQHPALLRQVRNWNDVDIVHKAIMSLYDRRLPGPQQQRRATSEILYRIDTEHDRILLQSAIPLARNDHGIRTTDLSGLLDRLHDGQHVAIRLDINAVRCQARTGKRLPIPIEDVSEWLEQKLEPALVNLDTQVAITVRRASGVPVHIAHVAGVATVNQSDELKRLIYDGIGRAKAYGCGLISVIPRPK
jgi:CRISPR system Cascade subunit CasE